MFDEITAALDAWATRPTSEFKRMIRVMIILLGLIGSIMAVGAVFLWLGLNHPAVFIIIIAVGFIAVIIYGCWPEKTQPVASDSEGPTDGR